MMRSPFNDPNSGQGFSNSWSDQTYEHIKHMRENEPEKYELYVKQLGESIIHNLEEGTRKIVEDMKKDEPEKYEKYVSGLVQSEIHNIMSKDSEWKKI